MRKYFRSGFAATACVMAFLCLPAQAGLEEGYVAAEKEDYVTAFKEWQPLAEAGNADAQYNLGVMYDEGQGVPQDYVEAAKWYRKAAEQGDADAQFNLGAMYDEGQGVPQDYVEAMEWYRKAEVQGSADAQFNIGVMYDEGRGVPQDYVEAEKWYRKAAEQGDADAQNNLGALYDNGQGVIEDKVLAYALYNLSAAIDPSENNQATFNRNDIAEQMSREEILAGQALTRELAKPGNFAAALDARVRETSRRR